MVVGHSMGGMLAARFATQYPKAVERLVIYNPIGLTDGRFDRPMPPIDELYRQTLKADYQSIRTSLGRYVAHNPKAWNAEFEAYARIRYSWTLGAEWPRLAMVQALISRMLYADPVVYDWARIQVPTLAFGGAEDALPGSAAQFQERMQALGRTIPNGNGRVLRCRASDTYRIWRPPRRRCPRSSLSFGKGSLQSRIDQIGPRRSGQPPPLTPPPSRLPPSPPRRSQRGTSVPRRWETGAGGTDR